MLVILLALLLAQILTAWILFDAHRANLYNSDQWQLINRTRHLTEQLLRTPDVFHQNMVRAASVPRAEFSLSNQPIVPPPQRMSLEKMFVRKIERQLGRRFIDRVHLQIAEYDRRELLRDLCTTESGGLSMSMGCRHLLDNRDRGGLPGKGRASFIAMSVQLPNRSWLNLLAQAPIPQPVTAWQTIIYLLISSALVLLAITFMVRRITHPLKALSSASHRLGRGEHVEPLQESGPEDLRKATRAFNDMNERLDRFIADRTNMLAALSHDLRTPITTLRLRIELLADSEDKERLLATLDEMQQMAEATLSFARESAVKEESRRVSLEALVDSLCEDLTDIGQDVSYSDGPEIITTCRPVSLRRALRNLIENAVKYGHCARVKTAMTRSAAIITIEDDGPGINENDKERIFEPFVRLESSRNRDTGGIGLGMGYCPQHHSCPRRTD